ncbi:transcription factor bHLH140 isoform X2 [Olea europaea subsp. europaea]|uniref:Transcription factor bHLH140 isoform X2 n=1 Tax=Olea europaea subsp. europaea TaxID=158383 RepID=A0A8S0QRB3_OLEEU|nr:transcription factor bHLH140 isoform X2 [Olea europaea subsp. europaea]
MEIDRGSTSHDQITRKHGEDKEEEERGKLNPIVVLLLGAPGSGKSTFCDHVMKNCPRPWARICQDTISNGKSGTKIQCLASAGTALKDGKGVFIDRCNLEREQRAEFLKLGGPKVEKHAVVLDLPAKLCISQSVKRSGHKDNLQGGKASAVVNRMLQKKELPKLSEGFTRITFCQDENDVQETINMYIALGPSGDAISEANVSQKSVHNEASKEKDLGIESTQNISFRLGQAFEEVKDCERVEMTSFAGRNASDNIPTLAFPSISTAVFQFNLEKASDIIVEKVEEFISKIGKGRLVLVDLSHGSKILSLVRTKAAKKNVESSKFFTVVGDITRLHSCEGLNCNVIANAANWFVPINASSLNCLCLLIFFILKVTGLKSDRVTGCYIICKHDTIEMISGVIHEIYSKKKCGRELERMGDSRSFHIADRILSQHGSQEIRHRMAQRHLLVLARGEGLDRLADVCREHLSLLKTMHAVGLKWAEKFLDENKSLVFRLGYHSAPSMRQLHLHVISQDFDSKHLKNKKHWNSFNTPFFRDSVDVIQEINEHGKAMLKNEDNFLSMELRCHRCQSAHPNIPRLRSHICSCQAPFPTALPQNSHLVFVPSEDVLANSYSLCNSFSDV